MDERARRIATWLKTGELEGPFELEIRPTIRCNLDCVFCHRPDPDFYKKNLTTERTVELVREAGEMGVPNCVLSGGGEPMFPRGFAMPVMEAIKAAGMSGYIVTNGTLYTDEMIKRLVEIEWNHIHLSMDAPDRETQDFLRGKPGSFDKSMGAVREFTRLKRENGSHWPMIKFLTVLTNKLIGSLDPLMDLAVANGVSGVYLQPMVARTPLSEELLIGPDQSAAFQDVLGSAIERARELGLENNFEAFRDESIAEKSSDMGDVIRSDMEEKKEDDPLGIPCFFPWLYAGVRPDGTVQPCPMVPDEDIHEDLEGKSLADVWHGEYFSSLREMLKRRELPECCQKCCGTCVLSTRDIRAALEEI